MTKLTLTYVGRFAKTSKAGKPYTSLSLKANEYGDRYISGFGNKDNEGWKEGDTVEVEIETKGEYLNFSVPKATRQVGGTSGDLNRVELKIDALMGQVATLGGILTDMRGVISTLLKERTSDGAEMPDFEGASEARDYPI